MFFKKLSSKTKKKVWEKVIDTDEEKKTKWKSNKQNYKWITKEVKKKPNKNAETKKAFNKSFFSIEG